MAVATISLPSQKRAAEQFDRLAEMLPEAGRCLRIATLSLRGAFSVADANIEEFISLRRSIVNDANAYRLSVLPVAKHSTGQVKDFMDYFQTLELEDVLSIKEELSAEAGTGSRLMTICKDMHTEVGACFRRQQDKIDKVLSACRVQADFMKKQADKLKASADSKSGWAAGLVFVPVVGEFATPLLLSSAQHDQIDAAAALEESQLAVNATFVIRDCLSGALAEYARAMENFASTFQSLAHEISAFLHDVDKFSEVHKKSFYLMCRKSAETVAMACDAYLTVAVAAESDLLSLPEGDDKNYVQTWLETHKTEKGRESFKDSLVALGNGLPKMLKCLTLDREYPPVTTPSTSRRLPGRSETSSNPSAGTTTSASHLGAHSAQSDLRTHGRDSGRCLPVVVPLLSS